LGYSRVAWPRAAVAYCSAKSRVSIGASLAGSSLNGVLRNADVSLTCVADQRECDAATKALVHDTLDTKRPFPRTNDETIAL